VTSGTVGLWERLLLGAVQSYRSATALEGDMATLGAASGQFSEEPEPDGQPASDDEALGWLIV
jgi:hypothetical protein